MICDFKDSFSTRRCVSLWSSADWSVYREEMARQATPTSSSTFIPLLLLILLKIQDADFESIMCGYKALCSFVLRHKEFSQCRTLDSTILVHQKPILSTARADSSFQCGQEPTWLIRSCQNRKLLPEGRKTGVLDKPVCTSKSATQNSHGKWNVLSYLARWTRFDICYDAYCPTLPIWFSTSIGPSPKASEI